MTSERRSGTVALVGRPNAGKSTLMNRLVAEKVAIVSDKPQTTRQRIVGILSGDRGQMVFLDTPGFHKPLHRMNRQMVRAAQEALEEADVVCLLVEASAAFGSGDSRMLEIVAQAPGRKILALNKIDLVAKPKLLPRLARYADTELFEELVPVSALTGDGCDLLLDLLWDRLPTGEPLHDPQLFTPHSERFLAAERIREKVLERTRDELPYTTAVRLDSWEEEPSGRIVVHGTILVERPGHKKILVGKEGTMIREIGTTARHELQEMLGCPVHLELFVRLEPGWREDRRLLADLDRHVIAGL
ncbi:MAG: GTPase Era [Thermoanaerobaculia bacterium]